MSDLAPENSVLLSVIHDRSTIVFDVTMAGLSCLRHCARIRFLLNKCVTPFLERMAVLLWRPIYAVGWEARYALDVNGEALGTISPRFTAHTILLAPSVFPLKSSRS